MSSLKLNLGKVNKNRFIFFNYQFFNNKILFVFFEMKSRKSKWKSLKFFFFLEKIVFILEKNCFYLKKLFLFEKNYFYSKKITFIETKFSNLNKIF